MPVGSPSEGADAAAAAEAALSSVELTELVARLAAVDLEVSDAERIEQLTALERVKAACAGAQARITGRFVDSQAELARQWHAQAKACADASDFDGWCTAREQARRHEYTPPTSAQQDSEGPPGSRGRRRAATARAGVAAQVALARHESPAKGTRLVSTALALTQHLPQTLAALTTGLLNEHRATLVARHTSHLTPELAAAVDAEVIGGAGPAVATWGDRELERHVRAGADRLDPAAATARARTAETERRVTLRPIPDTMALLTAVLPVAQAVAVHAALARAAATAKANGDPRSTGQIMADTLVALVTGQQAATDIPMEVQVIITDRALLAGEGTPAHIPGYGPVPAAWLRHLLTPDDEDLLDDPQPDGQVEDRDDLAQTEDLLDDAGPSDTERLTEDGAAQPGDFEEALGLDRRLGDSTSADTPRSGRPEPPPPREQDASPPVHAPPAATPRAASPRQSRRARTWLRRLYTHPGTGTLVTMDSRRRLFDAGLRRYLITRDGLCRTPWCNAPIRHLDHIHPHSDGGPSTATNGQGLCIRCNLVKDLPGWHAKVLHPGPTTDSVTEQPHLVRLTTPTGHTYTSTAPPLLPGVGAPGHHRQPTPGAPRQPAPHTAVVIELHTREPSLLEYLSEHQHLAS
jgi:hypothetical protein